MYAQESIVLRVLGFLRHQNTTLSMFSSSNEYNQLLPNSKVNESEDFDININEGRW